MTDFTRKLNTRAKPAELGKMPPRTMRLSSTIFAAISTVLLFFVLFFGVRSYFRYEGALHFGEGAPTKATAFGKNGSLEDEFSGRSKGWLSYRGQLTLVSIVNPVKMLNADPWETWSVDGDKTPTRGQMVLVWDARIHHGLRWGSSLTTSLLADPLRGAAWQLPYNYFTIPYWVLAVLLVILPYRWLAAFRRMVAWEREGKCGRCGTTVPDGVEACPKCGFKD